MTMRTTTIWAARKRVGRRVATIAGAGVLCAALSSMGALHPVHVTLAEAEVAENEQGHLVLQVALRVDPNDLEAALERRTERSLNLEETDDIDLLIVGYLNDVVQARHPAANDDEEPRPLDPCPLPEARPEEGADPVAPPLSPTTQPENEPPPSALRWIGKELDIKFAWLYFEVCLPETGIEGLEFSNRAFFELESDHVNTVNFREGEWRGSLSFSREKSWSLLDKKLLAEKRP